MQSRINYSIVLRVLIVTSVLLALCIACKENNGHNKEIHPYTNALIYETSPYLLQHAHNPVDWRPWSIEALEEAERENKLVLISVGYSSCHWCHVMEKETFENDSIAQLMNENFINIKVDREERPDIDQVYMTALQLIKGQGGWPLNIITLPNGKPLYGGTYHTKDQWEQVLSKTNKLYKDNPLKAQQYANMVANGIQEANLVQPSKDFKTLDKNLLNTGVNQWKNNWDHEWGGDIGSQKFMLPATLNFLLDYGLLTNDEETMAHVELTLDKMAMGGIYDHIGGGFFRYSTDSSWRVPHFEKMLYDNAQLIGLYSKAYKIFRKETYKHIVLGTISFLEREMKNTEGGYYAALDADSGGKEGNYYVWTEKELKSILKNDFPVFAAYYSISKDVVWQENTYILHAAKTDSEFVLENKISIADLKAYKKKWIEKLSAVRQRRIRPRKDDKVITSWNALLISGYIDAYTAFGNKEFLSKAASTIAFIRSKSYSNGKLLHTYKKNNKPIDGFLEDYSFLASACLKMYSVTMNTSHLDFAQKLLVTVEQYFTDGDSGMYTFTQSNELISKIIETNDGVQPSPNAVMANNLFILGHILYHPDAIKKSKKMLSTVASALESNPSSYAQWNSLLMHIAYPFYEIAIVGDNATSVLHQLQSLHIPNALIVGETNESEMPLFKGRYTADGTYIYVCRNNSCKLPVETVEEALGQLNDF